MHLVFSLFCMLSIYTLPSLKLFFINCLCSCFWMRLERLCSAPLSSVPSFVVGGRLFLPGNPSFGSRSSTLPSMRLFYCIPSTSVTAPPANSSLYLSAWDPLLNSLQAHKSLFSSQYMKPSLFLPLVPSYMFFFSLLAQQMDYHFSSQAE